MPWWIYRFGAAGSALTVFLGMSCLYGWGDREVYRQILSAHGIVPFSFPFVDASGSLAAWECARQGIDVILSDPCDVLNRGYTYSPLWMAAAAIPLGVADTTAVGWCLGLVFLLCLSLLPPPKRLLELVLVLTATLSTMVAFALERANPDIMLFLLALATGFVTQYRLSFRLFGYFLGLMAALVKYYPVMVLVVVLRERIPLFCVVGLVIVGSLAVFGMEYHAEIASGLPNIPGGAYNTDLFSSQNLPFLLGQVAENAAASPRMGYIVAGGVYAILVGFCIAVWRRLLLCTEFRSGLASLPDLDRVLLVIGSAVIAGCFFAGQSIGYRGVFLLFVLPGLLGIARSPARELRALGLGTAAVIVLLMWGECLRLAFERAGVGGAEVLLWLLRELCWWWTVSVMLAVLSDFLRAAPILRAVSLRLARSTVRLG